MTKPLDRYCERCNGPMPYGNRFCTQSGASQPRPSKTWSRILFDATLIVGGIVVFLVAIFIPPKFNAMRSDWMGHAKSTLRSIASIEHAYQLSNASEEFGSFEVLQTDTNFAKGQTLGSMVENYSLYWLPQSGTSSSFTVLALPRDTRNGYLNTFAVTDDLNIDIVRVYDPSKGVDFWHIRAWDPIL